MAPSSPSTHILVITALLLGLWTTSSYGIEENHPYAPNTHKKRLHFHEDGSFKIVQFSDLHFGQSVAGGRATVAVEETILDAERPDLVVISGDLVSGWWWNKIDTDWYKGFWEQLTQPMIKRNISWAIVLGNHDIEADLSGREIVDLDSSHPLSLTQHGPESIHGATNYYLPIYVNSTSSEIGHVVWLFDSGRQECMGVKGYGCVERTQIMWYQNESAALTAKQQVVIPGIAFFHIPLYEHLDLYNTLPVYGTRDESDGICCSSVNTGLYSAMQETGDIKNVFCGHDHYNDYYGNYHGITLGYGRKTGYGDAPSTIGKLMNAKKGARVIQIFPHKEHIRTWLRLEDASIEVQTQSEPGPVQFVGCCGMDGHGTLYEEIFIYAAIAGGVAIILLVAVFVVGCRIYVLNKRYSKLEKYSSVPSSTDSDTSSSDSA